MQNRNVSVRWQINANAAIFKQNTCLKDVLYKIKVDNGMVSSTEETI